MHVIPDLKRLEQKYPDELVVIGVHSAKFTTEKETSKIRDAIRRYGIAHPVVNDRDMQVWMEYGAYAWPYYVVLDTKGRIAARASGERIYDAFDELVGRLVREGESAGSLDRSPAMGVHGNTFGLEPGGPLCFPSKLAYSRSRNSLFITDSSHHRIVEASLGGEAKYVYGSGSPGYRDGEAGQAEFLRPQGICVDEHSGLIYVADTENHAIRKVDLSSGVVSTIAGSGNMGCAQPVGKALGRVDLSSPWDLALAPPGLVVAMAGCHQLWIVDPSTGESKVLCGNGRENLVDGPALSAELAQPSGVWVDGPWVYFADSEVSAIRRALLGSGEVQTLVGKGLFEFGDEDGESRQAKLQHPLGLCMEEGKVYVADTYNNKVKALSLGEGGVVSMPVSGLNDPSDVIWSGGKLYIADSSNHKVKVYNLATNDLEEFRITGLSRPGITSNDGFAREGDVIEVEVPEGSILEIELVLPGGTKLNPLASPSLKATGRAKEISLAISQGQASIFASLDLAGTGLPCELLLEAEIYYCKDSAEGLCFYDRANHRLKLAPGKLGKSPVPIRIPVGKSV